MERSVKRKLAIGAAGLVVLGGAGAAYGVTQSGDNERQAFLNDAAKRLNVSPDKLQSALKGAFADRLDAAVKAGRLTQTEADAIKKRVEQNGGAPFLGPGPDHGGFLFKGDDPIKGGLDAAANYLGLTDAQLVDKLRSGKSLADVAADQKKSVDGLKIAIRGAVKSKLDSAVKSKRITQDQENRILTNVNSRLDDLVNNKGFGPPHGRFFFHFGIGGPGGGDVAAKYLGLTEAELANRLSSGKSLADLARDQNKSVDGLKNAIRSATKSKLDAAVKSKNLTQAEENRILSNFDSRLDDLVNGKGLAPPPGLRHRAPFGEERGLHRFGAAPAGAPPPEPIL